MDGFEIDFADNTAGLWDAFAEASMGLGDLYYTATNARTGGGCLRVQSSASSLYRYISKTLPSTYTELYIGFGFYWASSQALATSSSTSTVGLLTLLSSTATQQITLGINKSTHVIDVYRGTNRDTLLGSSGSAVAADTMHYIELRVVISDTVGVVQVKLNGTTEINLSSQDTNNAGGGDIKTIRIGSVWNGSPAQGGAIDAYFDDFIVNDTTGTVSNSWPTGAGIEKLVPNADGNYTAWTSTGGAVDYTEIDDVATYGNLPDDDTTTILSATTGQRTSVNLTNTTLAGSVEAVMLLSYAKNSAAGADQMAQFVRLSSTDYDETAFVPATTYGWQKDILTLNPATSARWLTSEIDGMEQGWKRVT